MHTPMKDTMNSDKDMGRSTEKDESETKSLSPGWTSDAVLGIHVPHTPNPRGV